MSSVILVTDTEGNAIQLSLDEKQLIMEHADTKQFLPFEYIYAVHCIESKALLNIHTALKDEAVLTDAACQENKTIEERRPQNQKWWLKQYTFCLDRDKESEQNCTTTSTDNNNSENTVARFIEHLRKRTVPHQCKAPNTRVYVFLNPTSGNQQSNSYWKDIVRPMLLTAGFEESNIAKVNTERAGKTRVLAEDLGRRIQLDEDNGTDPIIISMGGDGTLHEVMNGLADAASSFDSETELQRRLHRQRRIRLGVIPTGSGNAFALGLNIEGIEHATLRIIKSVHEEPFSYMDVRFGHSEQPHSRTDWYNQAIKYDTTKKAIRLLVVLSWGFHAQIVSKSRYLRYIMGNKRFSLVAMLLLLFLQQYDGELVLKKNVKKYDPEKKTFVPVNVYAENEQQQKDGDVLVLDSKDQAQKKFTYFVVSKQHSLEKGFRIAPYASPLTNDLDIVLMRNATAQSLTRVSMAAFKGGEHIQISDVEYFKAEELLLRVKDKAELCIDGEVNSLPANGIVDVKVVTTEPTQFTIFV